MNHHMKRRQQAITSGRTAASKKPSIVRIILSNILAIDG